MKKSWCQAMATSEPLVPRTARARLPGWLWELIASSVCAFLPATQNGSKIPRKQSLQRAAEFHQHIQVQQRAGSEHSHTTAGARRPRCIGPGEAGVSTGSQDRTCVVRERRRASGRVRGLIWTSTKLRTRAFCFSLIFTRAG